MIRMRAQCPPESPYCTVRQATLQTGMARAAINNAITVGKLPVTRWQGHNLLLKTDLSVFAIKIGSCK